MKNTKRGFGDISSLVNILFHIILLIISLLAIIPFVFVIIISFTDEKTVALNGYSFFPKKLSLYSYQYIFTQALDILRSYGISIIVTVTGVIIGISIVSTYAYAISRKSFAYRKFLNIFTLIPMLFSGGLVANYFVVARVLGLRDSILALILPLAASPFYVFIMKSFFITSVPDAIIESGKMDGASELKIFTNLVIPISKPGIATIALFLTLLYWNDWFLAMMYIDKQSLIPIQYMLISIDNNINFLKQFSEQAFASEIASVLPTETVRMVIVVLTVTPIALVYPFFQKYFIGGLTLGAVKE